MYYIDAALVKGRTRQRADLASFDEVQVLNAHIAA